MYTWIRNNLVAFVALLAFGTTALLFSYQNRVVEAQRALIVLLAHDSYELQNRKMADTQKFLNLHSETKAARAAVKQ